MKVEFTTVDVFTDRKFGGNPLAVVTNAQGLASGQMQSIAAEFNLAETTFVRPPQDATNTAEVRIFTPKAELPFAGHPNVGTVAGDRLVFEEKAGLVRMDLTRENGVVVATRLAAPVPLSIGEEIAPEIVAEACSLAPADIKLAVHRPCIASCGIPLVFAELQSRALLARAAVRTDVLARHLPMERAVGIHLYVAAEEHGVEIQSRMFAPLVGVPEDPATGGANVALIGLLAHHRPEADLVLARTIGQGFDMGRPSVLEASAEKKAGKVVATYIGGRCVPMMKGTIDLD